MEEMNPSKTVLLSVLAFFAAGLAALRADPPVIPASNFTDINNRQGEVVTVEGVVHNIFWVRNQTLMITFQEQRGGFVAVSFARHREVLDQAFGGDIVRHLAGKTIRVTGEVSQHEYRPQIVVRTPDQVQIQ